MAAVRVISAGRQRRTDVRGVTDSGLPATPGDCAPAGMWWSHCVSAGGCVPAHADSPGELFHVQSMWAGIRIGLCWLRRSARLYHGTSARVGAQEVLKRANFFGHHDLALYMGRLRHDLSQETAPSGCVIHEYSVERNALLVAMDDAETVTSPCVRRPHDHQPSIRCSS